MIENKLYAKNRNLRTFIGTFQLHCLFTTVMYIPALQYNSSWFKTKIICCQHNCKETLVIQNKNNMYMINLLQNNRTLVSGNDSIVFNSITI